MIYEHFRTFGKKVRKIHDSEFDEIYLCDVCGGLFNSALCTGVLFLLSGFGSGGYSAWTYLAGFHFFNLLSRILWLYLWGNFRYNFFFFSGVLLYNVAGILIFLLTGVSLQLNPTYMGFSIFLAYSLTLPDTVFYLYFFIPIKAKYLALFETVLYLYFLLVSQSAGERLSILLSFLNVLLFFLLMHQGRRKNIFNIRNYR